MRGDIPIINSTWFSIELSSSVAIPEFNNVVLTLPQVHILVRASNSHRKKIYSCIILHNGFTSAKVNFI